MPMASCAHHRLPRSAVLHDTNIEAALKEMTALNFWLFLENSVSQLAEFCTTSALRRYL